jgi:SAM-dependent methyltransferase
MSVGKQVHSIITDLMIHDQTPMRRPIILDRDVSAQYRESDEIEVLTENHKHFCDRLRQISLSSGDRIAVLDLGCGTGRYFHCLQNVQTLMGIDVSLEMVKQARSPVKGAAVTIGRVDLVSANILDIHLRGRFNLIYSIGVFGEFVPWDIGTCNRLHDMLKPGGKLFFTVVDVFSKYPYMSKKRRIAERINLILPLAWRRRLRQRLGTFYVTEREIISIFKKSKFRHFEVVRRVSTARLWKGAHYECLATKQ